MPALTSPYVLPILMLVASNVFMTFAWYGHLRTLGSKPVWIAILASWGIALVEYMFQVPANRLGSTQFSLPQLKIIQEIITLSVFVPYAIFFMNEKFRWDFVWAGCCMVGAVYFIFRSRM